LESLPFLECLDSNLLAIIGLKKVYESKITLPEFGAVEVVLIVNLDGFSLNIESIRLGLRLLPHLGRSNRWLQVTKLRGLTDLFDAKSGHHSVDLTPLVVTDRGKIFLNL
jgi:hypothetical protein